MIKAILQRRIFVILLRYTTHTHTKIDKLDFIKCKNFPLKDNFKKMERKATDWEKIFANHISVKDLYPE